MILSKVMQKEDYDELVVEGKVLSDVHAAIQMWNDKQHNARLWEYTIAQKALKEVFGTKTGLLVSDHGCGAGYLAPILCWLGHNVVLYEIWTFGNEETYMLEQMRRVVLNRDGLAGKYEVRNRGLGGMTAADRDFDAAFCISTIEHIKDYRGAFRDMCRTVKPGGLVFITSDYGEHENDDYEFAYLRAGKMFCQSTYEELEKIGESEGCHLLGKKDWAWKEECRLVANYGFASLAMVKKKDASD